MLISALTRCSATLIVQRGMGEVVADISKASWFDSQSWSLRLTSVKESPKHLGVALGLLKMG